MKKKIGLLVLMIAVAAGAAFAQKVGDTVQIAGQTYRIEQVNGNNLMLTKVLTLDGVWLVGSKSGEHQEVTISGNSGSISSLNNSNALWLDAKNKGYYKVGTQFWRNLRSTGNLTWSGQQLTIQSRESAPNVAIGSSWGDCTITMSADGKTITSSRGHTFTRQ